MWPISPSPGDDGRIKETESNPPPKPGRADTLQPNKHRVRESHQEEEPKPDADLKQKEMLSSDEPSLNQNGLQNGSKMPSSDSSMSSQQESRPSKQESSTSQESDASSWMPKPPKVLMEDDNATPLELRSQIQLYATNEYVLLGWLCILTFMTVHLGNSRILLYPPSSKVPWVISVPCISLREMGSYFAMKLYIWLTEQHTQTNYLHQKLWTNQSDRERIWRNSGSLQRSTSRCLMVSF